MARRTPQASATIRETAKHPVPRNTSSWLYVFGSAALTVFLASGESQAFFLRSSMYLPPERPWNSLQILNHSTSPLEVVYSGPLHGWGSNFMIAIVLVHMVQESSSSAHTSSPVSLTWMLGVFTASSRDPRHGLYGAGDAIRP